MKDCSCDKTFPVENKTLHKLHPSASIKGKVKNNESLVDTDSVFNCRECLIKQAFSQSIVAMVKHQKKAF